MEKIHDFIVLAFELRLPCIKPPKLYVKSSKGWKHIKTTCAHANMLSSVM